MQAEPTENTNLLCTSAIDTVSTERDESSFEPVTDITPVPKEEKPTLIKDAVYYMDTVAFKVQDHIFKVPTYYFRQKTSFFVPHFASMEAEEKVDDETLIELDDVTPTEFRALLKFIYPIQTDHLQDVPPAPTTDEWIAILKLSTQWMMLDIRRVAITVLSSADIRPADRVVLAREYKIDSWLRSSYLELVKTASSMTQEDMNKVGLSTAFKIHKAREKYMTASNVFAGNIFPVYQMNQSSGDGRTFRFQEMTVERSAIERVALARAQGVAEWLRDAFIELVKRHEPLTVDESRSIGFDTAMRLYSARERTRNTPMSQASSINVRDSIDQELREELQALTTYQSVERAVLAKRYGVMEWLHQAFVELVERPKAISVSDAKALGHETAIRLAIVREINTSNHYSLWGSNDENVGSFVDKELADELRAIPSYGPVDRVLIARKTGVDQWIQRALDELLKRKEMLTDDEAVALGLDTCIQLSRFRLEGFGSSPSSWADPSEINIEFQVELNDIQQAGERYIQPGFVLLEGDQAAQVPIIPHAPTIPHAPIVFQIPPMRKGAVKKGAGKKKKK